MSKVDDSGPAFPAGSFAAQHAPGMTLRDWFAGKALVGLVGTIPGPGCASWDYYSEGAYKIADAMLAERNKGPSK